MKFLFKITLLLQFLFLSPSLKAREVILLENLDTDETGNLVIKILEEKFNIPRSLITYKKPNSNCTKKSEAILQLCLKPHAELEIVKIDRFVMENSFDAFFQEGERNEKNE